jgi:hypothetical protein
MIETKKGTGESLLLVVVSFILAAMFWLLALADNSELAW